MNGICLPLCMAITTLLHLLLHFLRLPEANAIKGKDKTEQGKGQVYDLLVQTEELTLV